MAFTPPVDDEIVQPASTWQPPAEDEIIQPVQISTPPPPTAAASRPPPQNQANDPIVPELRNLSTKDRIMGSIKRSGAWKTIFGDESAGPAASDFQKQGLMSLASIPGRIANFYGKGAQAAISDVAEKTAGISPEENPYGKSNLAEWFDRKPLPIKQQISDARAQEKHDGEFGLGTIAANVSLSIADMIPKILTIPEGGAATQATAGGLIFGVNDENNQIDPKSALIGAAFPLVTKAAGVAAENAIGKALDRGWKWLASPTAQKAVHLAANQAAMNATTLLIDSPDLLKLSKADPTEFKRQVATIVGQNVAFAIPEALQQHADPLAAEIKQSSGDYFGSETPTKRNISIQPRIRLNTYVPPEPGPIGVIPPGGTEPINMRRRITLPTQPITTEVPSASEIPNPASVSQPEIRTQLGESPPLRQQGQVAETRPEIQKEEAPNPVVLKPGDEAPVVFRSVQDSYPKMGWYEPTRPFIAPDNGVYAPGDKIRVNTGQLKMWGYKIPDAELEKFKSAGGTVSPDEIKPAKSSATAQTVPSLLKYPPREVPAKEIVARPELMQFKEITNEKTGENEGEKLTGKWDESKAGLLMLWEPKDPAKYGLESGQKYIVANGHHRFAFGERENVPAYGAQIFRESDGYTAKEIRRLAAEANIADGKGTIYDRVKFLRNVSEPRSQNEEMGIRKALGRRGEQAANIAFGSGDDLHAAFVNEKITPDQAEAIAVAAPNNLAAQRVGLKFALEGKNPDFLTAMVRRALSATGGKSVEMDLFGSDDSAMNKMAAEEAKASEIRKGIREQIQAVSGASKRPELARKLGVNVKDPAGIQKRIEELKMQLARWENWFLSGNEDLQRQIRGDQPSLETVSPETKFSSEAKSSLELAKPESVDEQKARLAEETRVRLENEKEAKAKSDLAEKATARTGGDLGSAGQGGLFVEPGQQEIFQPKAAELATTKPAEISSKLVDEPKSFRVGNNPQSYTLIERLSQSAAEKENGEQPVKVRNDKTGKEEIVMESDLTPIKLKTAEEKASSKTGKVDLDEQLQSLGLDPSVFPDKASKKEAIKRAESKLTPKEKADRLAASLEKYKKRDNGQVYSAIFPGLEPGTARAIWNTAIDVAQRVIRAGGTIAEAIESALRYVRDNFKGDWSEEEARKELSGTLQPPPEETPSVEPENRPRHQVAGVPELGTEYDPESISAIQGRIRENYFDSRGNVEPQRTQTAWDIANRLTEPQGRAGYAEEIRNSGGGEMAPGLVVKELWDYALKMTAARDDSLLRFIVNRYVDFEAAAGGGSFSKAGTVLRAARELASNPLWKGLIELYKDRTRAASRISRVGEDLFNELTSKINELNLSPEEIESVVRQGRDSQGRTLEQILESVSPERTEAQSIVGQYSPRIKRTAFETVYEWLKRDVTPADEKPFIDGLAERLMELGNRDIDEATARQIAELTWTRKNTIETARRRAAWDQTLKELDERAERTARSFADRLERTQTEWQKDPARKNAALDLIREALNPKDDKSVFWPLPAEKPELFRNPLRDRLMELGVSRTTAMRIADEIYNKRITDWTNARTKAMQRAADRGSLRSLIDVIQNSTYRAQQDPAWRLKTAEDWFLSNGLNRDQAKVAARIFSQQFEKSFADAREKLVRRFLSGKEKSTIDDLVKAVRLGLTDPSRDWADVIATRSGWKPLTAEQHARLADLEQKRIDPKLSPQEFSDINAQMMTIFRHSGDMKRPGMYIRRISEGFVGSLLSGVRTVTVQFAPIIAAIRDYPTMALSDPKNALNMLTAMYRAAKEVTVSEIKFGWQKDAYGFHLDQLDRNHNELKTWFETLQKEYEATSNPAKKAWARTRQIYAAQQYVSRILSTLDQTSMAATQDWKLPYYANIAFKEAGISTKQIGNLVDAMAIGRLSAYERAIADGLDHTTAKVRANSEMRQLVYDFVNDKTGSDTLAAQVLKSVENDIYSLVGRHAIGIGERDEGFLSKPFNVLMEKLSQIRGEEGSASILAVATVGFVNVPFRTTRFFSTYSPYGLLRYGIYKYRMNHGLENHWKQSYGTALQARARFREAIAGTVVMTLAAAWASKNSTSDDNAGTEKFGMYITGAGPRSRVLQDAFQKSGWKAYSLNFVIDGHKSAIPLTRIGESLMYPFILPAAMDDAAWHRKEIAANGRTPPSQLDATTATLVGTAASMMGQKGALQSVSQMQQAMQGGAGTGKALLKTVMTPASAIVLPFKQALASISDMFVGPLDQSSMSAIIANNFPIVGLPLQNKAINRFGDDLYDRSWYGKIVRTGIPVAFQVEENPENKRLYDDLLLQKGAAPPELRRFILEEKYGPLTDDQWLQFSKLSGQLLKESVVGNLGNLAPQSPEDVKKFLNKAANSANADAAAALGLEPVKQGAGGGSGASSGSLPASTSGTSARLPAMRGGLKSSGTRRIGAARRISIGGGVPRKIKVSALKPGSRRVAPKKLRLGNSRRIGSRRIRIGKVTV